MVWTVISFWTIPVPIKQSVHGWIQIVYGVSCNSLQTTITAFQSLICLSWNDYFVSASIELSFRVIIRFPNREPICILPICWRPKEIDKLWGRGTAECLQSWNWDLYSWMQNIISCLCDLDGNSIALWWMCYKWGQPPLRWRSEFLKRGLQLGRWRRNAGGIAALIPLALMVCRLVFRRRNHF